MESNDALTPHQLYKPLSVRFIKRFNASDGIHSWLKSCRLARRRAYRKRYTNNAIAIDSDSARASLLGGADRAGDVCLGDLGRTSRHALLP